jgi:hypothetical protein
VIRRGRKRVRRQQDGFVVYPLPSVVFPHLVSLGCSILDLVW